MSGRLPKADRCAHAFKRRWAWSGRILHQSCPDETTIRIYDPGIDFYSDFDISAWRVRMTGWGYGEGPAPEPASGSERSDVAADASLPTGMPSNHPTTGKP